MARRFRNVTASGDPNKDISALVDAVQYITAQSQDKIQPLSTTATTAEIIAKINQIISRLQGT